MYLSIEELMQRPCISESERNTRQGAAAAFNRALDIAEDGGLDDPSPIHGSTPAPDGTDCYACFLGVCDLFGLPF